MRAVVVSRTGGPERLVVQELPEPEPGVGEIRIRVTVAGVTFGDIIKREGLYPDQPPTPFVPGAEVVGIVDKLGPGTDGVRVGTRVAVFSDFGGYSESLVADAKAAIPVPAAVSDNQAAALTANYFTAYQMLRRAGRAEPGDLVLVHGASGGVGTALLELAKWLKLSAWATASASKHSALAAYGAKLIDYSAEDFVQVVRKDCAGGVDLILDAIGGSHWRRSLACLRPGGRLVAYGFQAGFAHGRRSLRSLLWEQFRMPRPSLLRLMNMNTGVIGYSAQNICKARRDWYNEDMAVLMDLCAKKTLNPIIFKEFPLDEAAAAHRLLASGLVIGKITLRTSAKLATP